MLLGKNDFLVSLSKIIRCILSSIYLEQVLQSFGVWEKSEGKSEAKMAAIDVKYLGRSYKAVFKPFSPANSSFF